MLIAISGCGDDESGFPLASVVEDDPPGPSVRTLAADPQAGDAPLQVSFQATVDVEADGDPDPSYSWDFGDGSSSTERMPTHTYAEPGTYDAWLTVTDADGQADREFVTIEVGGSSGGTVPSRADEASFEDWAMGANEACMDAAAMVEEVRGTVDDPVGVEVVRASVEATNFETAAIEALGVPEQRAEEVQAWLAARQDVADFFIASAQDDAISDDEALVLQERASELLPLSKNLGLTGCAGQ